MINHRVYRVRTNNWIVRLSHWGQMPHTRVENQTQFNRFDSRIEYDYDLHLSTNVRGEENFDMISSIHSSYHLIGL